MTQKLILWDWDNTLVDTFGAIFAAQNDTRVHFGLSKWTIEESKKAMNTSGRNLLKDIFGEEKATEARVYFLSRYAMHAAEIQLNKGAKEILYFAQTHGFINVLASNKAGPILRNEAETLGVTSYFDKIIGAEDTDNDKPSKFFTDAAIKGFDFDSLISIGDGKSDIKMAHNYENGVGVLVWTDPNTPEFNENKPDFSFATLADVQTFLGE